MPTKKANLPVALLEQKMIGNELILHIFSHSGQRKVGSLEFGFRNFGEHFLHFSLHVDVVGFGKTRIERVSIQRASASNARRVDVLAFGVEIRQQVRFSLAQIRLRLFLIGAESVMIVFDDRIEQRLEKRVRLRIRSVDSDATVQIGYAWKLSKIKKIKTIDFELPDWITSRKVAPSFVFLFLFSSTTSRVKYFFNNDLQSLAFWKCIF